MKKRRAVIVLGDGNVILADGVGTTAFDLDEAMKKGATISQVHPIGLQSGTSILVVIEEG